MAMLVMHTFHVTDTLEIHADLDLSDFMIRGTLQMLSKVWMDTKWMVVNFELITLDMRDLQHMVEGVTVDVVVTADEMVDETEEIDQEIEDDQEVMIDEEVDLEAALLEEVEVVNEAAEIEDHVTIQMIEKIVVDVDQVIDPPVNQDHALDPAHDPNPDN